MRKNMLALLYILAFIIILYILQIYIVGDKTLFGVKPNLFLISALIVSLWYGLYIGTLYAFCIGLITDILYSSNPGMLVISYTVAGMIVGLLHYSSQKESKISIIYATFVCVFIFEIIQYTYYAALTGTFFSILYLLKQIIISSVLNIVITYIFYGLILKFTDSLDLKIRKDSAL